MKIWLYVIFGILICILSFSCNTKEKKETKIYNYWRLINIKFDNKLITVFEDTDSLTLERFEFRDSTLNGNKYRIPKQTSEDYAYLTHDQKDSIYKWGGELIKQPFLPTRTCTDYYGKLSVEIKFTEQARISCYYSSICEWNKMNSQTKKLDSLFKIILKEKY